MADIFLSYAKEDRAFAAAIVPLLEAEGWSIWWDRRIPAGTKWRQVLEQAMQNMRCMIVLWSKHSVLSDWVIDEAEEGKTRGKLIPLIIEAGVLPPRGFRQVQTIDFSGWNRKRTAECFDELIRGINGPGAKTGSKPGMEKRSRKSIARPFALVLLCVGAVAVATIMYLFKNDQPSNAGIALDNLSFVSCTQEGAVRTINSLEKAAVTFDNATAENLRLFWINGAGRRETLAFPEQLLPAGKALTFQTYLTHPWLVANTTGECIAIFLPKSGSGLVKIAAARPAVVVSP